jgi:hypothetical protein
MAQTKPPPGSQWTAVGRSWKCPRCGKRFIQRGLWHSCSVYTLDHHFAQKPAVRTLFDRYRAMVREAGGPFRLSIAKTRIGFIAAMTFAGASPRKAYLRAHFVMLRKISSPRFVHIESIPPYWVYSFEIRSESDLDEEARAWLTEAYTLGKAGLRALRLGR